ncbi:MAG: hypothetical protein KKI09_11615 [Spirochaetes bacterium]|nr:hypothetical protein [Spirochaetota bacterium]MBU0956066.1 hypothetical protein [Spirochaetota bacterium]
MKSLFLLYKLIRRKNGNMEITLVNKVRIVYLVLSVILLVVLGRSLGAGHPLMLGFYVILPFMVISEDRWVFNLEKGYMQRRFGLVFISKSWQVPLDEVSAIEYSADLAAAMDSNDPLVYLPGAVGKKNCGLRVRLADGKSLTMYAAAGKHFELVKQQALSLANAANRPAQEI